MTKEFESPAVDDLDDLVAGARGRFGERQEEEGPRRAAPAAPSTGSRHDGTTARRHNGVTAEQQSKFTVLLDQGDAAAFDELALALRRRVGRRVGKGDIVRVLIRLTLDPDSSDLLDALASRLAE